MAISSDPTMKDLVELSPQSWPVFLGRSRAKTTVIDADIATVSGAGDKVIHVAGNPPYLIHLEFHSGHDAADQPRRMAMRNFLLDHRHNLTVLSAIVVLRKEADSERILTGKLERTHPWASDAYLSFQYEVIRVWTLEPEKLLSGGLALMPLAPISKVTKSELPAIIKEMEERLEGERERLKIWQATAILLGFRHDAGFIKHLLEGVSGMQESVIYQLIRQGRDEGLIQGRDEGLIQGRDEGLSLGAVAEIKKVILSLGKARFGRLNKRLQRKLESMDDLEALEAMSLRILSASTWAEVFAE